MKSGGKKFFLIGILALLILTIPLTLYFVKQQQDLRSSAAPSSNLSLVPSANTVSVGEIFTIDVILDPGNNIPSFVKFALQYDPQKLSISQLTPDSQNISVTLDGPTIASSSGMVNVEFGINKAITGYDPTVDIGQPFKVATLQVEAVEKTDTPTQVAFDFPGETQVLSIATDDNPGENVLVNAPPTLITILGGEDPSPTQPPITPSAPPTTPTPTETPNVIPVCTNLEVTPASGSAPLVVQFTAKGNDPDGQITKATFNFGDGQVIDVTSGLGSASATVEQSHTYNTANTYSVNVVFTDNRGGSSVACTQSVLASATTQPETQSPNTDMPTATPTLAPPGSIGTAIGVGGAVILTVIGGILLFIL